MAVIDNSMTNSFLANVQYIQIILDLLQNISQIKHFLRYFN